MFITAPQAPIDTREVVRSVDADGQLVFGQVGVEELNYSGRFGALGTSSTSNSIAIGEHYFTLDVDDGKFKIGDDILITSLDDQDCFMWGEIIETDTVAGPIRLRVYVDDVSNVIGENLCNWELQVVAHPKFGITKDTSISSVDPTAAGPFTFTVTAGKFFPIGGKLLMIPLAARQIALVGLVKAYSGNSLVVEKNSTNATVSTSYTSWAIALLDAPQNKIPKYQITGLQVTAAAGDTENDIFIAAGSVRDFADTVDIVLPTSLTKRLDAVWAAGDGNGCAVVSANLTGTVTSVGITVTGTGTNFLSQVGLAGPSQAILSDWTEQVALIPSYGLDATNASIISSGTITARVDSVTDNTHLGTQGNLAATGATYKRGGAAPAVGGNLIYAIGVCVKDADGTVDVFACSFNADGQPDLPSGYTAYRTIAFVQHNTGNPIVIIKQPLRLLGSGTALETLFESGAGIIAENVAEALDFLMGDKANDHAFQAHLLDTSAAHAASAISYAGGTGMSATDVEAAIDELATEKLDAASYTATDVLTKIKTVDGAGSGLDADLLDGNTSAFFATATDLALKLDSSSYTAADVLTKVLTVDGAGSGLDADLLDGNSSAFFATAASVSALPVLSDGVYTPTLANTTNITASTAHVCQYLQVGNTVTVSGRVVVDPTTTGIATELRMTLPIGSAFISPTQLAGTAASDTIAGQSVAINGSTGQRASFQWITQTAAAHNLYFTFTYRIA